MRLSGTQFDALECDLCCITCLTPPHYNSCALDIASSIILWCSLTRCVLRPCCTTQPEMAAHPNAIAAVCSPELRRHGPIDTDCFVFGRPVRHSRHGAVVLSPNVFSSYLSSMARRGQLGGSLNREPPWLQSA